MTVRRVKTYTAETGRVYQYYFVGDRPGLPTRGGAAHEYIFDVLLPSGRYAVSVFLRDDAVRLWASEHGRPLGTTERFACAKLRLHRGFDEIEDMLQQGRELWVTPEGISELLETLDLD